MSHSKPSVLIFRHISSNCRTSLTIYQAWNNHMWKTLQITSKKLANNLQISCNISRLSQREALSVLLCLSPLWTHLCSNVLVSLCRSFTFQSVHFSLGPYMPPPPVPCNHIFLKVAWLMRHIPATLTLGLWPRVHVLRLTSKHFTNLSYLSLWKNKLVSAALTQ